MEGVTITGTIRYSSIGMDTQVFWPALITLLSLSFVISLFSLKGTKEKLRHFITVLVVSSIFSVVIALFMSTVNANQTEETWYEVRVSKEVDMEEFQQYYEIREHYGNYYIVKPYKKERKF